MTDEQIIKALEGAVLNSKRYDSKVWPIEVYKLENALDLINRQQAEIERLKEQVVEVSKTIKSEAVKEFVDRLKEVSSKFIMCDNGTQIIQYHQISTRKLDSILKEMVGDEK